MKQTKKLWELVTTFLSAAMFWFGFGFKVIPVLPHNKKPAVLWDPWLNNYDSQKVVEYWEKHPDHEVGCIVGDDLIVFDADSKEAVFALVRLEARFGLMPKMVVNTAKGQHHYFCRAPNTIARSDSHDSEKYPDRIDVKTGRALVVLPISTGKTLRIQETESVDELSIATQKFIDAIYEHNGRTAPSEKLVLPQEKSDGTPLYKVEALLENIDPDCGYEDWLRVGMAIYHETAGSDEGKTLFDRWSSKGQKYKGIKDIETKWRSFRVNVKNPVTVATLVMMAQNAGADMAAILSDGFEPCDFEIIYPDEETVETPLVKYSLRGMSDEIAEQLLEATYVLDEIAILGQLTLLYSFPNTGKTLLTLYLQIQSIKQGNINPNKVFYVNVDDTQPGLVEKLRLAEEFRFHMLAEGYKDFKGSAFFDSIKSMIETDTARGVVIILDTLKKFVDLMNKSQCAHYTKIFRRFVMKGGTIICLAHTNKKRGGDGKPIYGGTSDMVDDSDCVYILDVVKKTEDKAVVVFENIKKRGHVASSVAYSYSLEQGISYNELLLSVDKVDNIDLATVKQEEQVKSDAEVIEAIKSCILDGINTKMKLAAAAAERANVSKKSALRIIEKYEGEDPAVHQWSFKVRDRGAKVYELLTSPSDGQPDPPIDES